MPLYEYRCRQCRRNSTFLVGVSIHEPAIRCRHCGSDDLERLLSRVRHILGEDERMERMLDPSALSGIDENDPKSVARWARKMGQSLGDEAGEDFDDLVEEMEEAAAHPERDEDSSTDGSLDDLE